jgi:uncharacterized protein YidB (DUF937 family)
MMGLFDSVVGALGAAAAGGAGGAQPDLLKLVGGLLGPESGGLAGLVQKFQQGGLGDVVASWVGTGANLPISAEQISQVLGPDTLQQLARQFGGAGGVGGGDLAGQLAQMLPQVVDQLTPNGQLPAGGGLPDLGALGGLLGGLLKR